MQVSTIPAPHTVPESIYDCFDKIFEHEVDNTKAIYMLVKMSFDDQDWPTWNFMQWFVKEQIEEETLVMNLRDKMKIAGGSNKNGNDLYTLDGDLDSMPDDARSA